MELGGKDDCCCNLIIILGGGTRACTGLYVGAGGCSHESQSDYNIQHIVNLANSTK